MKWLWYEMVVICKPLRNDVKPLHEAAVAQNGSLQSGSKHTAIGKPFTAPVVIVRSVPAKPFKHRHVCSTYSLANIISATFPSNIHHALIVLQCTLHVYTIAQPPSTDSTERMLEPFSSLLEHTPSFFWYVRKRKVLNCTYSVHVCLSVCLSVYLSLGMWQTQHIFSGIFIVACTSENYMHTVAVGLGAPRAYLVTHF